MFWSYCQYFMESLFIFYSVLVMSILPQGPDYDLPIRAEMRNDPIHKPGTQGPVLLGDRQYLDFGGVAMGNSL